jgi:hypothetical protein
VARWVDQPLPLPAPSERERIPDDHSPRSSALRLMDAHAAVTSVLGNRSAADFRPLPSWATERAADLRAAFAGGEGLPPSLVAELAPLVAPRLERVVDHLRRRLGRERVNLPLGRVREMDTACVRRAARLPGRTLVEKAGPRQEMVGVVRVPRFDTMENRVLLATCRVLVGRASAQLRVRHTGGDPRARALRRLARAAQSVIDRPELEAVGAPRPSERPTNALLGDADYRAVWRAGQLLKSEDDRFAEEWGGLSGVWRELILLATWAAVDARGGEPLPTWVRVLERREAGVRVQTGEPRRWIDLAASPVAVTTVQLEDEAVVVLRVSENGREQWSVPAELCLGGEGAAVLGSLVAAPDRARAAALVAAVIGAGGDVQPRPAVAEEPFLSGVCALDARIVVAGEEGLRSCGPTAAAISPVTDEAPLEAFGRAATWMADPAGPSALLGARAGLGGALMSRFAGRHDTAVVVPDGLDDLAVRNLRARLGRAWFVWSPVAAALAAAEARPDLFPAEVTPRHVLVIVATDAALDVAVLEETHDEVRPGRLWVRSVPLAGDARGREGGGAGDRFGEVGARGAWLRDPDAAEGWAVDGDSPRHIRVPPPASVVAAALARAAGWKGVPPGLVVAVGLAESEILELREQLPIPVAVLDTSALAAGARTFLVRHRAGLPTWKDRLPTLSVEVRRNQRREERFIVKPGTLVAPGDRIELSPEEPFELPMGVPRVAFRLSRENRPASYELVLDNGAFPLRSPASVRLSVRYTYGLQGLEGSVVPVGRAPFAHVPFRLEAADAIEATAHPVGPPERRSHAALTPAAEADIRRAIEALERVVSLLPPRLLKEAQVQPGKVDKELLPALSEVFRAAKVQGGVGPSGELRGFIEGEGAPLLEWLLGLPGARRGRPPLLGRDARFTAVRARGELAVGSPTFVEWLGSAELPFTDRVRALGRAVDGQQSAWDRLRLTPTTKLTDHGDWAEAVRVALLARPELAATGDPTALLDRVVGQLEALSQREDVPNFKKPVLAHLDLVPWLCYARPDALAPGDCADAIARLGAVRDLLPEAVRAFGGRASANTGDEPISVAIDYLLGRYVALPEQR